MLILITDMNSMLSAVPFSDLNASLPLISKVIAKINSMWDSYALLFAT